MTRKRYVASSRGRIGDGCRGVENLEAGNALRIRSYSPRFSQFHWTSWMKNVSRYAVGEAIASKSSLYS